MEREEKHIFWLYNTPMSKFFFPSTFVSPSTVSADNGKIETNFDDFEEDWEGSQDMAMSVEAQAVLAAAHYSRCVAP